ncbi:DNA translocase FtsK 4TM domain-containing protein [bacterium]|nr:DNA translocase FtsK 4TM domain-containing protein [bacterium]
MNSHKENSIIHHIVARNRISKIAVFKAVIGILILLALISFNPADPGPFNLLFPIGGIQNILGLSGALLAGFLIEMFGFLGFSIPLIIVFSGRKQESLNFRLLLPEILELLSLVTLVALLIPNDQTSRIQIVGLWGHLSSFYLTDFPGKLISLGVLGAYQLVYFKENRLDLSFISLINLLLFLTYRFFRYLLKLINQNIDKSSKYYVVNWITPLKYSLLRQFETMHEKVKQRLDNTRLTLADIDLPSVIIQSVGSILFRKKIEKQLGVDLDCNNDTDPPAIDRELLMEEIFYKYSDLYFKLDQAAFQIHEEEILI